ncbi:MAG: DJ-1/PfpI family protein [Cyanobacteria bacterium P01_G01_bin.54]
MSSSTSPTKTPQTVGILIFDDVEILDFCGPYEVFGVTGEDQPEQPRPFQVFTIAVTSDPVLTRNQMSVTPRYSFETCPALDILLVPGGQGSRQVMHCDRTLAWINQQVPNLTHLLSVCTGALVVAKAGLLDGLQATTHHTALDLLRSIAPQTEILPQRRIVDNGKIVFSGGIAAGIDMSLYMVAQLQGRAVAIATANEMEYDAPFLFSADPLTPASLPDVSWPKTDVHP